jgi:energy-converting hydrogenase Eha subunit A
LIIVDLVLGIAASFYTRTFSLTYIANFTRNDVLGKVFPWFVLSIGAKAHVVNVVGGIDLSTLADGVFVGVVAALVGSLITSLSDFGIPVPSPLQRRTEQVPKT